jgi:hypothetical protein
MTFRFAPDEYSFGFLAGTESIDETEKYMLYKEYDVDLVFPFMEEKTFDKYKETIKDELPLCYGSRIIGKGKITDWVFV